MKKKIISLAIVSMFSSVAIASNAVLNVEGVIQINGNTVIGSDGKVTAAALPGATSTIVDLSDYQPKPGVYTYQYIRDEFWEWDDDEGDLIHYQTVCTEVDNIISAYSVEYSSECKVGEEITSGYFQTWTDNQDGTETWSWENTLNSEWPKETWTQKVAFLVEPQSQVALGGTTAYVQQQEVTESSEDWHRPGEVWTYARSQTVTNLMSEFSYAGATYSDCIVSSVLRGQSETSTLRAYCAGIGMVMDFNSNGNYHLVSYESASSKRTSSKDTDANYLHLADKNREILVRRSKIIR
ncbi:hypothetical protein [Vibrio sp. WXL210]|uniref:hypothetical protein n=1 Tax=Vibrio sp. WXL210 TaxID=3450709 RepID=UPI003EC83CE5